MGVAHGLHVWWTNQSTQPAWVGSQLALTKHTSYRKVKTSPVNMNEAVMPGFTAEAAVSKTSPHYDPCSGLPVARQEVMPQQLANVYTCDCGDCCFDNCFYIFRDTDYCHRVCYRPYRWHEDCSCTESRCVYEPPGIDGRGLIKLCRTHVFGVDHPGNRIDLYGSWRYCGPCGIGPIRTNEGTYAR